MTGPSPIRLMILSGPEQRGQTKGSASYTFLISRAHERLRSRPNSSPLSQPPAASSAAPAGGADAEAGAPGGSRRAFEKAP